MTHQAPNSVDVSRRRVGATYVASTRSLPGLVHVGTHYGAALDDRFLAALNAHAEHVFGGDVCYAYDESGVPTLVH